MPGIIDLVTNYSEYPTVRVQFTTTGDAVFGDSTREFYLSRSYNDDSCLTSTDFRTYLLAAIKSALEDRGTVSDVTMTLYGESSTDVTPA